MVTTLLLAPPYTLENLTGVCLNVITPLMQGQSKSNSPAPKYQLLIKTKVPTNKEVSSFKSLRCCIYHTHLKMQTIVGITTFMSRIKGYVH